MWEWDQVPSLLTAYSNFVKMTSILFLPPPPSFTISPTNLFLPQSSLFNWSSCYMSTWVSFIIILWIAESSIWSWGFLPGFSVSSNVCQSNIPLLDCWVAAWHHMFILSIDLALLLNWSPFSPPFLSILVSEKDMTVCFLFYSYPKFPFFLSCFLKWSSPKTWGNLLDNELRLTD